LDRYPQNTAFYKKKENIRNELHNYDVEAKHPKINSGNKLEPNASICPKCNTTIQSTKTLMFGRQK
jgi:uncharacterized protein with PIN domain